MHYALKKRIILCLLLLLQAAATQVRAQELLPAPGAISPAISSPRISLLTAMPGPEIYELYGHLGLRITDPSDGSDLVYNYGVFDFNAPGFVPRFVKGETDYMVAAWPYPIFLQEYQDRGSQVVEHELALDSLQKQTLIALMKQNVRPENCTYRYMYLTRNCATQILDKIDEATGNTLVYPTASHYKSWRDQMRQFNQRYPWYQFGIDLALGAPLDNPVDGRKEMFMPVVLSQHIEEVKFANGAPLIKSTRVVNEGCGDMRLPATPWYLTPMFIFCLLAVVAIAAVMLKWRPFVRWYALIWLSLCGLAGLVIWYLTFISIHQAASPNILCLWAGPQCFVAAWIAFCKQPRPWMRWFMRAYLVCLLLLASLSLGGLQVINPAMWPVLLTTLLLCLHPIVLMHNA